MESKFTDAEIVKALECCREKDCGDCPMIEYPQTICKWDAFDLAIDLINRQKAEIERLQSVVVQMHNSTPELIRQVKAEAIKEFAERLKEMASPQHGGGSVVHDITIDNLVKEMTGENNGN